MQQIDLDIGRQYDLKIKNVVPFRNVIILNTDKGKKLLKKENISPGRILFVHGAKEHLNANGFKNIDRYVCTVDGNPYIDSDQGCFTLADFIEGSECDFDETQDVLAATVALAKLHSATKGYNPPAGSYSKNDLGKLPDIFKKRLDEIRKIKRIASKGKTKIDFLVLNYVDYFYNQGFEALKGVSRPEYNLIVEETRKQKIFCHCDYNHYNVLMTDGEVAVTNFSQCRFELKVYDLANLIRRKMRKCNWDIGEASRIIETYGSHEELSRLDLLFLFYFLQFPQKFWRVINRYYNSRKSWSEKIYSAKLTEVAEEIPYHSLFLSNYAKKFL